MSVRDQWSERLSCRYCGANGNAVLSQANPDDPAYHDGSDQNVRVERAPVGFMSAANELGCQFFCAGCGAPADYENSKGG